MFYDYAILAKKGSLKAIFCSRAVLIYPTHLYSPVIFQKIVVTEHNHYGRLPKSSNTLNIRTLKIIAKYNFKMFPKISNSG